MAIVGVADKEAKKEFMKIKNPNMKKIRKAANTYEKEATSAKLRTDTSKAYQIKNTGGKDTVVFSIRKTTKTDEITFSTVYFFE